MKGPDVEMGTHRPSAAVIRTAPSSDGRLVLGACQLGRGWVGGGCTHSGARARSALTSAVYTDAALTC